LGLLPNRLIDLAVDHGRRDRPPALKGFRGVDQARREEREQGGEASDEASARARPFYGERGYYRRAADVRS